MKVAISGAGVAGPTLAYWLHRAGHAPTLIEQAPAFRAGGYVIDFWGVGYAVAERMGLIPAIRAKGYQVRDVRLVKESGATASDVPVGVFSRLTHDRYTSLLRGDLAEIVFAAVRDKVETVFGASVASLSQGESGVTLKLTNGAEREFDLVVGADGLHSNVRRLVWGEPEEFQRPLGYHVAAFDVDGYPHRDDDAYVSFARPGLSVSRFALREDRTVFLFVFESKRLQGATPRGAAAQKALLRRIFADLGWETAEILAALERAADFYFDAVAQVELPSWSKNRAVLVGDAAACPSLLAGEGTGLGMTEAYVLAGELHRADGNAAAALRAYEARLRSFLAAKQKSAREFASSFAPRTEFGIWLRNVAAKLMVIPPVADAFLGQSVKDDFDLPDYGI